MTENMLKYQCPACGGPLHFDSGEQMIVCDYCDEKYEKDFFDKPSENDTEAETEQVDWKLEGFVRNEEIVEGQVGYVCTSCGAEVVSDGNTASTECMYCGNPIVLNDNVSGMVKPDLILPFKIDKDEAEKMLKSFYLKKILLPSTFRDKNRIKKIVGYYVPFWLFSGKGDGKLRVKAEKSSTHRDGDYKVTTTKHFNVIRDGSVDFIKIPVDASEKMDDHYMDGLEPYDYNDLKEFSPTYMAGYFADKFDVDVDECAIRANKRIAISTRDEFLKTVKGYSSKIVLGSSIHMRDEEVKYVLLPVWVLNTNYQGKMYRFAINGQTGKVSGELPIDKTKKLLLQILLTIMCYIPLALIGNWVLQNT